MPITQASTTTFPDHRIFGIDGHNRYRANLYHGSGHPCAGSLYSWVTAHSEQALANTLAEQWEQPLSEEEFDVLEELEGETLEVSCDDCGGSGVDIGGLSAYEPENCHSCNGTGVETLPALRGFGSPTQAPRMACIGNGLYVRSGKAVA